MSNESGGFFGSDSANVGEDDCGHILVPLDLIRAVAHIGIDFGYGKYELEQKHIDEAKRLVDGFD